MVEFNVTIGQELQNVNCCDVHPHIIEYHETINSFTVRHSCPKCGSVGSFGMLIPKSVRDKQIQAIREAEAQTQAVPKEQSPNKDLTENQK